MNVTFYNFSKRRNSTKLPASTGTVVTCQLKEPCSLKNPRLLLSGNLFNTYDYAYIGDFGRYYFVSDVVSVGNGLTEITLEDDVLASHKTAIGSTVARIAFASTGWNKHIVDPRMCVECDQDLYNQVEASGMSSASGYFVLSVVNNNSNGQTGAAQFYVINIMQMTAFMQALMDPTIVQQIINIFGNPMESVLRVMWLPYLDLVNNVGSDEWVVVGDTKFDGFSGTPSVMAKRITNPVAIIKNSQGYSTIALQIPYKWQDFRDCAPYNSLSLYLPGVGLTDLNANDFYNSTNVNVSAKIDMTSGDILYLISDDGGKILKTVGFNGAVEIPLARLTTNAKGALTSIGGVATGAVGIAAGIATENPMIAIGGAAGMMASAANAALAANQRSVSIKGSTTGRIDYDDPTYKLIQVCKKTEDCDAAAYIASKGRPVAVSHAISNHSGYVQCDGASVSIAGDAFERDEINSFLNNGFFYE